jgi:hypothetical protein
MPESPNLETGRNPCWRIWRGPEIPGESQGIPDSPSVVPTPAGSKVELCFA